MLFWGVLRLLIGILLFLFGMNMLSQHLHMLSGEKLNSFMKKYAGHLFPGIVMGTVFTAIVQSSTAITVLLVGMADEGMISLNQVVAITLGANIGTTITNQIVVLPLEKLAPIVAILGLALQVTFKKTKSIGGVLSGMGVLLMGMENMQVGMVPLARDPKVLWLLTEFSNPIGGVIGGCVFTALLQSSSASIAVLQALAQTGGLSLLASTYLIYGMNIGTCFTALLSAMSLGINAKRTAMIHLLINVLGTVLFVIIGRVWPYYETVGAWTPKNASLQIANIHTVFNVGSTILLLPFCRIMVAMAVGLIPEKEKEKSEKALQI